MWDRIFHLPINKPANKRRGYAWYIENMRSFSNVLPFSRCSFF